MQRRWSSQARRWQRQDSLEGSGRPHLLANFAGVRCLCPGYHLWLVPSYQEKYFRWLEVVPPLLLALCVSHILWIRPSLASQSLHRIYSIFTPPEDVAPEVNATKLEKGYEAIYTLEISTTGPAIDHISYLMGKYTKVNQIKVNGRPVWMSSGWTFSTIFYYSRFNKWMVKALLGPWFLRDWMSFIERASQNIAGEMKSRKSGPDEVPEFGWLYWNGEYWKYDPDLRVTGEETIFAYLIISFLTTCQTHVSQFSAEKEFGQIQLLTITSFGRASILQDALMGRYHRLPDTEVRQRPVWTHENNNYYLYFDDRYRPLVMLLALELPLV